MADQSLDPPALGPSAALARAMVDDGVDVADESAVTAWIDDFNTRPFDGRAQALAGQRMVTVPVALLDDAQLDAAVRQSSIMTQMAAFLEWVGDGRRLTPQRQLGLADAKRLAEALDTAEHVDGVRGRAPKPSADVRGVDLVIRLALATRLVRRDGGTVVQTDRGRAHLLPDGSNSIAREIWRDAVTALLEVGAVSGGAIDNADLAWWELCLDGYVTELLCTLMVTAGMWAEGVAGAAVDHVTADHDVSCLPAVHRVLLPESVAYSVLQLIDRLAAYGVVRQEDRVIPAGPRTAGQAIGTWIELTPLGNWFVRPLLIALGFEVPVFGQHARDSADELIDAIASWQRDLFAVEVRLWAGTRAEPAAELVAAAVAASSLHRRELVFQALDALGEHAIAAVRTAVALPVLRPFAIGWLMEYDAEPEGALDVSDDPRTLVEALAVILVTLGPDAVCTLQNGHGSGKAELAMIEGLWRVNDPYVRPVLEALGRHRVKPVAKAARRALFKLRNL